MCCVIQFIIAKSTSVKELRAAIIQCSNPASRHLDFHGPGSFDKYQNEQDVAREYLQSSGHAVKECILCAEVVAI